MTAQQMSWDDLQYFLAVAQTGQLSRAAYALQSSHVTVSRHIDRLELAIGVALFHRGPKGYALTTAGLQLRDFVEKLDADTCRLPALLSGVPSDIVGPIRLNMPEGMCNFFCAQILPEFRRKFPKLALEVAAIQQLTVFTPNATDISIVLDPPKSSLYHTEKIVDYSLRVFGSNAYLDAHEPITSRADFLAHPFIGYIDSMVFMPSLDYLVEVAPKLRATLQCSSIFSQMKAVRHGLGLAVLPDCLASRHSDIRPVLGDTVALQRSYWTACRSDLRHAPRESVVIEEMMRSIRARAALLLGAVPEPGGISAEPMLDGSAS